MAGALRATRGTNVFRLASYGWLSRGKSWCARQPTGLSGRCAGRGFQRPAKHLIEQRAEDGSEARANPINPVAAQAPASRAGPKERAGFMEAAAHGPPHSELSATAPPMANAAEWPAARVSVACGNHEHQRRVAALHTERLPGLPAGVVAPKAATGPNSSRRQAAAANRAGELGEPIAGYRAPGKWRVRAKARVTAG